MEEIKKIDQEEVQDLEYLENLIEYEVGNILCSILLKTVKIFIGIIVVFGLVYFFI